MVWHADNHHAAEKEKEEYIFKRIVGHFSLTSGFVTLNAEHVQYILQHFLQ